MYRLHFQLYFLRNTAAAKVYPRDSSAPLLLSALSCLPLVRIFSFSKNQCVFDFPTRESQKKSKEDQSESKWKKTHQKCASSTYIAY